MPEEAFIDALLLIGSFSDVDVEQISDIRLAVTNSVDEPSDDRSEDCGGSPYLSYPAADSGTASYANGVEVFCNQRGQFVHIIKEAVPAAIQATLLSIPQNFQEVYFCHLGIITSCICDNVEITSYTSTRTASLPTTITAAFQETTITSVFHLTVTVAGLADSQGSALCTTPELDCIEKFTPSIGMRQ